MTVKFSTTSSNIDLYNYIDTIDNGTFIWNRETKRFYIKMNDELSAITPPRKPTKLKCIGCGAPLPVPEKYSAFVKCSYCDLVQDIDIW